MKKLIVVLFILNSMLLYSQNDNKPISICHCSNFFLTRYTDYDSIKYIHDKYYIGFEMGFNDTLQVYINGKLIHEGFYKTDPSLDAAGPLLLFQNFEDSQTIITVLSKTRDICLEFPLDIRFGIAYIDFSEERWSISYTNTFAIYE